MPTCSPHSSSSSPLYSSPQNFAGQTEIVAILASGVSFRRLMFPYFIAAAIIAVITFFLASWVIPIANRTRIDFENTYIKSKRETGLADMHMQIS